MDKKMLTVTLTVEEVLEEPAVVLCESAHGSLLVGPTDSFHWTNYSVHSLFIFYFLYYPLEEARISRRRRRVSHDSHVKNNS